MQLPQVEPSDGHIGAFPHTPPEQVPLQHCPPAPHIPPSGVHCGLPQMPFEQRPEQQSAPTLHLLPSGVH